MTSLTIFLYGTFDRRIPLSRLRGQTDVLRMIWMYACEEWWNLHIDRFPHLAEIPDLSQEWRTSNRDASYPKERYSYGGCPAATIAKDVIFPPITSLPPDTLPNQIDDALYINMMPFDINDISTLPVYCQQYWPIITLCKKKFYPASKRRLAFLSIDERPALPGNTQRRQGLHVESPGVLPLIGELNEIHSSRFVPGVEHHWGNGIMMRSETVDGGIFLGSNLANTTAVWNCRIRDDQGDIIAPHGSIERCRKILGPPSRTLDAGEIMWLTDKTPHESLSLPYSTRRQFFRLVLGEVTAWFVDHSTFNPTGYQITGNVRLVEGNKYQLYDTIPLRILWYSGTIKEIQILKKENEFREILYRMGLGHIVEEIMKTGLRTLNDFILKARESRKESSQNSFFSTFRREYSQVNEKNLISLTNFEYSILNDMLLLVKTADDSVVLTPSTTLSTISNFFGIGRDREGGDEQEKELEKVRIALLQSIERFSSFYHVH